MQVMKRGGSSIKRDATYSSRFLQLSSCNTSILLIVSLFFLSLFDSVTEGGGIMVGMLDDVLGNRDIVDVRIVVDCPCPSLCRGDRVSKEV